MSNRFFSLADTEESLYCRLLLRSYVRVFFMIYWERTKEVGWKWLWKFTLVLHIFLWGTSILSSGRVGSCLKVSLDILDVNIAAGLVIFFCAYPISFIWSFVGRAFWLPIALLSPRGAYTICVLGVANYSGDLVRLREESRVIAQRRLLSALGLC